MSCRFRIGSRLDAAHCRRGDNSFVREKRITNAHDVASKRHSRCHLLRENIQLTAQEHANRRDDDVQQPGQDWRARSRSCDPALRAWRRSSAAKSALPSISLSAASSAISLVHASSVDWKMSALALRSSPTCGKHGSSILRRSDASRRSFPNAWVCRSPEQIPSYPSTDSDSRKCKA